MEVDGAGMQILSRAECLALLRHSLVGRVIVTDRALPAAFPVNFALLGEDVVFRTAAGSKLEAASARAVVAFEVDDMDPVRQTGWSVLVQGRAALIEDPVDLARASALPLQPWAPGRRLEFVRVRSELVSGRRIPQPAAVFART